MRSFRCVVVMLMTATSSLALAQPPEPPRVEVGAQASIQIEQEKASSWSPRITFNLTPMTAIEATADFRPRRQLSYGSRVSSQAYSLQWRQTLFASGRWQVFGVLGAGGGRVVQEFPEQVIQGRDGPEVIPASTYVDTGFAAHLGPAVQFEAARWLALRADLRLTAGHGSGLRGMVGAAIPIGRRLLPLVGTRDSLKNGMLIGGVTGAVSGAALLAWAASVFCEYDSCDQVAVVAVLMGAGGGAVIGGLIGAMVDALVLTPETKAVAFRVAWR